MTCEILTIQKSQNIYDSEQSQYFTSESKCWLFYQSMPMPISLAWLWKYVSFLFYMVLDMQLVGRLIVGSFLSCLQFLQKSFSKCLRAMHLAGVPRSITRLRLLHTIFLWLQPSCSLSKFSILISLKSLTSLSAMSLKR